MKTSSVLDFFLEFVRLLRLAGVRVGLTETQDAVNALTALENIENTRTVLRATLVKSCADQAIFDRVFDLYFGSLLLPSQEAIPESFEVKYDTAVASVVHRDGFAGDGQGRHAYAQALERAAQMILHHAYVAGDSQSAARTQEAILLLSKMVQQRTHSDKSMDDIQSDLEKAFLRAADDLQALEDLLRPASPESLDFSQLDETEAELVEREIERLLAEMLSRSKRRYYREKRGRPDIRRTLRKSIQYGGTPIKVARKKRRLIELKIFVLADISSSVAAFARFFLLMTRAFHTTAKTCRSFVFVDTVREITERLEREMTQKTRAGDAVAHVLRDLRREGWGVHHSDYGTVLQEFFEQFSNQVDRHALIVILGDARSNQTLPKTQYLQRLSDQAERVVWLNPERRALWDSGDSIIGLYAPSCDRVLECRNLEQLKSIVCELAQ